jgi:glycosyltransferase involved in cell wall biosynthesis
MNKAARLSVVIPAYNHAQYIDAAVRSVLNQTLSDLELIVVDDGSQDDTCARLAAINDPRLSVVTQENQGAHAAINRGLHMATAPYLAILNSDDVYHVERFARLLPLLEEDASVGLVASHIEIINAQGAPMGVKHGYADLSPWPLAQPERAFRAGNDLRAALLGENYLATTSNFLFRRSGFAQTGDFRPLRYTHDWDFVLRMAQHAGLVLHPEPLLQYRIHGSNTIRENQAAMIFEICWCLAVHLPQHVADASWFDAAPWPVRTEQLLHSLHTFECERVLTSLLVQEIHRHPARALALLEVDNPARVRYLEYIQAQLAEHPPVNGQVNALWAKVAALRQRFFR